VNEHDYHALPSLSHGKLEDLIADPTLFHGRHIARTIPPWEGSDETELGAALHKLVLEGSEEYARSVAVWCGGLVEGKRKNDPPHHSMRRGTNAYKAWEAEQSAHGRSTIVDVDAHGQVLALEMELMGDPDSRALLTAEGPTEHTLTWSVPLGDGTEIPCKARLDKLWTDADVIVDLKTTRCATLEEHRKQAIKLGYHRKADWYRRGYLASTGRLARAFLFVSIRTVHTPVVWVWQFDGEVEAVAEIQIDMALDDYRTRTLAGDWTQIEQHNVRTLGIRPYEIPESVREEMERRRQS
jgi:hypothetical protein